MTHESDASKKHNRTISIVAGPNGAGKSTFVDAFLNGKNSDFALLCFSFGYQPRKLPYGELQREWHKEVTISLFPIFDDDMRGG